MPKRPKRKGGRPRKRIDPLLRERSGRAPRGESTKPNAIVGERRKVLAGKDGDLTMTTTPLDLLLTRGLISEQQYEAGRRYAALRRFFVGRADARAHALDGRVDGPSELSLAAESATGTDPQTPDEERVRRMRETYDRLVRAQGDADGRGRRAVFDVVVAERYPRWLHVEMAIAGYDVLHTRPSDERERAALLEALSGMAEALGLVDRMVAA